MKLSNKLLIGFFGGVLLYLSAAFTEVRLRAEKGDFLDENLKVETVPLGDLKYLVLSDLDEWVFLKSSDNPRLEIKSRVGDLLTNLNYELSVDSLIIRELNIDEDSRFNLTIHIPSSLIRIINIESIVQLSDVELSSLSIEQTGGRVVMNRNVILGKLSLEATQRADIDAFDLELDTLQLKMDNSNFYIQSPINRLEGTMTNRSDMILNGVNDFAFKKDESSNLRIFN